MSVVYTEDASIAIGGVILPGLYKSIEVDAEAAVEEQEIEGSPVRPKQAVGYEDAKLYLELELWDGESQTKEDKLQVIQNMFRTAGQSRPEALEIVSTHSRICNIDRVILKNMTTKATNQRDVITVSLELWEYVPLVVSATRNAATETIQGTAQQSTTTWQETYYQTLTDTPGKAQGPYTKHTAKKETLDWSSFLTVHKTVQAKFTDYAKTKKQNPLSKNKAQEAAS